jgi:hypothetical protein
MEWLLSGALLAVLYCSIWESYYQWVELRRIGRVRQDVRVAFFSLRQQILEWQWKEDVTGAEWAAALPGCRRMDREFAQYWGPLPFADSCESLVLRLIRQADGADTHLNVAALFGSSVSKVG